METIFAPCRMEYIKGEKPKGCVFCKSSIRCDDYIMHEGKSCFVMMNRYPYNTGHLMIIPTRHVAEIEDLTQEERIEIFALLDTSIRVLKEAMNHLYSVEWMPDLKLGTALGAHTGRGLVGLICANKAALPELP